MRLHNTLTRQREDFVPADGRLVRMYACGLTVYARGHIGNFRTFISLDVLRRTLKYVGGFAVKQVVNFTDVDDKTIAGAVREGVSLSDFTERYIAAFHEDCASLGLEPSEENPRATDGANIQAMNDMIATLEQKGHTYRSDGSIYFKIATMPTYGRLARLDHAGILSGARVDSDEYAKEDARDFVLWKATKPGEPTWDPGVGPGRPGWHCACCANRRSTSTPAASTSSSRTTRTRSRRANAPPASRSRACGCTSNTCWSRTRRCRSRSATSTRCPT
jgi:cysteinyl-tRNA synthetase